LVLHGGGSGSGRASMKRSRGLPSPRERGEIEDDAASGGEWGGLADALDGVADGAQAGVDGVCQRAQACAGIAVLHIRERHFEGDEQGAEMAEVVGDVEQGELRFFRERRRGRGCRRYGAPGLEQRLHLRDLGGRAANSPICKEVREPGGVCREQAVALRMIGRRLLAGKGVHASPLSSAWIWFAGIMPLA
jgi:hypothetical protein